MKYFLAILVVIYPLFFAAAEISGKVACVDFNRALNEVADGKRAKARLKDEFKEKQQQLDRFQKELVEMRAQLDRDRLIISQEALSQKEEKYRQKFSELQQRLEGFKKEISAKEAELTGDILGRLKSIVKDVGAKEGYALILEKSQEVLLYSPEGSDVTDRVIQMYDRLNGVKKK